MSWLMIVLALIPLITELLKLLGIMKNNDGKMSARERKQLARLLVKCNELKSQAAALGVTEADA